MNLARQNPALLCDAPHKGARIIPVGFVVAGQYSACTHTKAFARWMTRYDFCIARSRNHHSHFRPVFVWLLADHCREQAGGATGHYGNHGSDPGNRMSRLWRGKQGWAQNIAIGRHTAREIVLALIVDDCVRGRAHRKNIFNPTYNVAGASLRFATPKIRQRLQNRFRQWLRGKQISGAREATHRIPSNYRSFCR